MAGHVSMMNDVLIAQMPIDMMRSTMRYIVSQDPAARTLLVQHVRKALLSSPLTCPPADKLFPANGSTTGLQDYLRRTRCYISCHLTCETLNLLAALVQRITENQIRWEANSELEKLLEASGADIIQAIQAVKESQSQSQHEDLLTELESLLRALHECNQYCLSNGLAQPFSRAQSQVADAVSLLFPAAHVNGFADVPTRALSLDFSADSLRSGIVERIQLGGGIEVPRMFNGLWQMSSPAWGSASASQMDDALVNLIRNGLLAADMADHYGDAELVYGSFRNRLPENIGSQVITATKWCVFAPLKEAPTESSVLAAVQERADRVGGRVELLQFHWQDYDNADYLPIIKMLVALTQSRPDLVSAIGLCNFDAKRTEQVCEYMIEKTGSVGIVSNQVQYSLIDSRPMFALGAVCEKYGIHLLTYGSFCGGFLSDRWHQQAAPNAYGEATKLTPSQRKYLDMIYTWGSWDDFSQLLNVLRTVADKHQANIANVATRWVLQRPEVGSVIVGTRLGVSSNAEANLGAFKFQLSADDISTIEKVALGKGRKKAQKLYEKIGDCGQEYR